MINSVLAFLAYSCVACTIDIPHVIVVTTSHDEVVLSKDEYEFPSFASCVDAGRDIEIAFSNEEYEFDLIAWHCYELHSYTLFGMGLAP